MFGEKKRKIEIPVWTTFKWTHKKKVTTAYKEHRYNCLVEGV